MKTIQPQPSSRILLLGESCKDIYEYGNCERLSPEAPVPIFIQDRTEINIGMANNVHQSLLGLGFKCDFITNNPDKLIKRRFIDNRSMCQLMRQDIEEPVTLLNEIKNLNLEKYNAIVISDYNKGLLNDSKIKELCDNFKGPIFVDSKRTDLRLFKNAIIKINDLESKTAIVSADNELIITLGKRGVLYKDNIYGAPKVNVHDVTGAGDVFLSALCYFYLKFNSIEKSIPMCIKLASKSVSFNGSYIIRKTDLNEVYN